eukprot:TRINITY_DN3661_c0_g1_i2.p1 TRINITY_DN3661_c0_g1~~TRINITY_DN3661_c0_g1_i2.p1  ORF type:complete len:422 (-),score=89.05 TRINITY_DN3661_c0_g1_i2:234-1457(-)
MSTPAAKPAKKPTAVLIIPPEDGQPEKRLELPILQGSLGPSVIDIRKLHAEADKFSFDPGFMSTGSCESKITFIDGDAGVLLHGGYSIEQLAEHSDYYDVSYLLLFGELPDAQQRSKHIRLLRYHTMTHETVKSFFRGFRSDAHPMAMMVGVVGSLSSFYHATTDMSSPASRLHAAYRLVAKMPTVAAMAYKTFMGQPYIYPRNDLSYSANFLNMMFARPSEPYELKPIAVKAMDILLLLHADHEQNASTSTVRIAASSGANPFAAIASGIASLWGPAHGGANEAVLRMLQEIGSVENIPRFVARAKDKNDTFRLMGFGHRVYHNYDPRATIIKRVCHQLLSELRVKNPLLELAMELEKVALADPYFKAKKLFPNVDYYSGIVLTALGIPIEMSAFVICVFSSCHQD